MREGHPAVVVGHDPVGGDAGPGHADGAGLAEAHTVTRAVALQRHAIAVVHRFVEIAADRVPTKRAPGRDLERRGIHAPVADAQLGGAA